MCCTRPSCAASPYSNCSTSGSPTPARRSSPYAAELVRGVQLHRERIDELLAAYAEDWTLDRMPAVDRNILRIGAYELLWAADVPDGVAISEAVQLARSLSTEASPAFVNGLLARLLELKPTPGRRYPGLRRGRLTVPGRHRTGVMEATTSASRAGWAPRTLPAGRSGLPGSGTVWMRAGR